MLITSYRNYNRNIALQILRSIASANSQHCAYGQITRNLQWIGIVNVFDRSNFFYADLNDILCHGNRWCLTAAAAKN